MTKLTKDFIVAMNYAHDYGYYNPRDKQLKLKAYKEFGKYADELLGDEAPNGLTGIWWDEIKQFVEKGVIDWSFVKNLQGGQLGA